MSNYPAQIDTSQSLPSAIDNSTPVTGSIINRLRDTIIAIESELGVKPSSVYSTVKNRLDIIESTINTIVALSFNGDLSGNINTEAQVIGIQGRPISSVTPQFGEVLTWNGIAWAPLPLEGIGFTVVSKSISTLNSGTTLIDSGYTFVGGEQIILQYNTISGIIGHLAAPDISRIGTNFVVNSYQSDGSIQDEDNSSFDWLIVK